MLVERFRALVRSDGVWPGCGWSNHARPLCCADEAVNAVVVVDDVVDVLERAQPAHGYARLNDMPETFGIAVVRR